MKLEIEMFKTADGVETAGIRPQNSRRQKSNWYIWVKPDGSGQLIIDSAMTRVILPPNRARKASDGPYHE